MTTAASHLDRLLAPLADCLTPEVAARVADLRTDDATQQRIDYLADRANEGLLSDDERDEYAAYVHAIDVIAVLQAKAPRNSTRAQVMDAALRALVRRRAGEVCEYCRLPQASSRFARFHVEHIIARQHGGTTEADNLALACSFCNLHKGPNIAALDNDTGQLVSLFHPRCDRWADHFAWQGEVIGRPHLNWSRHGAAPGHE